MKRMLLLLFLALWGLESPAAASPGADTKQPVARPLAASDGAPVPQPAAAIGAKPTERRLFSDSTEASSFLWNDWNRFQENYHPNYLADDDPTTGWAETYGRSP